MDSFIVNHSYWILLLPLLSFLINGLYLGKRNWKAAAYLATGCIGVSLLWVFGLTATYYEQVVGNADLFMHQTAIAWEYNWMPIGSHAYLGFDLVAKIGMLLDPISIMMLIVICTIAFLVNIYSIGYMKDDPSAGRFFALLSLFTFSMLGLVISTNILQMFVFWELVGLSSFLLIAILFLQMT